MTLVTDAILYRIRIPFHVQSVWNRRHETRAAWIQGKTGRRADQTFRIRIVVQALFALASLLAGVELARFYDAARAGSLPPSAPPRGR